MRLVLNLLPIFCFGFLALAQQQPARLPDHPVGITSFGATYHAGAIYTFGGQLGRAHQYSREQVSQPLYRLKLDDSNDGSAKWEALATDLPALGPSLLSHSSGLIRIGGMQPRNAEGEDAVMVSIPDVRRYDPASGEWSALPSLPKGRSSHDAFISGDRIYVAGGWTMRGPDQTSKWSMTVDVLDLSDDEPQWRSIPAPFFRRALAVAVYRDQLLCIGGLDKSGDISREVDILDLTSEQWSTGPELPDDAMLAFGSAVGVDQETDSLYLTGFSGTVYRYLGVDGWQKAGQLEHGRMFARWVDLPEGPLVIMGGAEKGGRPKKLEWFPENK